uniref:(northern house mosquito) hypothetical protein n=1 Tax=Culex pipiens TaxID=7175 RepID=A0A8D8FIQ6_CULPI
MRVDMAAQEVTAEVEHRLARNRSDLALLTSHNLAKCHMEDSSLDSCHSLIPKQVSVRLASFLSSLGDSFRVDSVDREAVPRRDHFPKPDMAVQARALRPVRRRSRRAEVTRVRRDRRPVRSLFRRVGAMVVQTSGRVRVPVPNPARVSKVI